MSQRSRKAKEIVSKIKHKEMPIQADTASTSSKPAGSDKKSSEVSEEENVRRLKNKFYEVIKSALNILNCKMKNSIPNDVLILMFEKGRWEGDPQKLSPSWVKAYNKFSRIDGPGFNFMRRDHRALLTSDAPDKLIAKFSYKPYSQEQSTSRKIFMSKEEFLKNKSIKKKSTIKKKSSPKRTSKDDKNSSGDFTDTEVIDKCKLPLTLLMELRRDVVKQSAAASIAFEIICEPTSALLLKRLFLFEKHQLVTEWEIAKETYRLRDLDWKESQGMIRRCNEIAKEMISLDRTLDALNSFTRYKKAREFMPIFKNFVEAEKQCKRREKCESKKDNLTKESEKSEGAKTIEERDEEVKEEGDETEKESKTEESKNDDLAAEGEKSEGTTMIEGRSEEMKEKGEETEKASRTEAKSELKNDDLVTEGEKSEEDKATEERNKEVENEEDEMIDGYEKEANEAKKHMANCFIDLIRTLEFFSTIRQCIRQEDEFSAKNYLHYILLCCMAEHF